MTVGRYEPGLLRVVANGIELAAFEWHPQLRGQAPTLVLTHATGFHARCWDAVARHLHDRHVIAIDQRGHGRSEKAAYADWQAFGHDLAALVAQLGITHAIGVGHSMGGHATVVAAAADPSLFDGLVLIDPVIFAPAAYAGDADARRRRSAADHPTARRRNRFATVEQMIDRFADREPYSLFVREVLEDYCRFGLLPADDGDGLVLACPPEFEASVYATSRSNRSIHDQVRAVRVPVAVVRAIEPPTPEHLSNFAYSPTWPALAGAFEDGRDCYLPGRTHFLPMQDPRLTAELITA